MQAKITHAHTHTLVNFLSRHKIGKNARKLESDLLKKKSSSLFIKQNYFFFSLSKNAKYLNKSSHSLFMFIHSFSFYSSTK